jgi:uncharacterized protein YgiM (DUF1202 family)
MMNLRKVGIGLVVVSGMVAACAPQQQASVQLVADNPVGQSTSNVIFVTPTPMPTTIPTMELITPSITPTPTQTPTFTPDANAIVASCQSQLNGLYASASELCLGKPDGYFCNGGFTPVVEPAGAIGSSLASAGAVVEAELITSVTTPPLLSGNSGGIMYLHMSGDVSMNALLLGDVQMRDNTPPGFPKWKNFIIRTNPTASDCTLPTSAFVMQSEYGQRSNVVINGVSIDVNGTIMVITASQITKFISLEGLARFIVNGVTYSLFAGQQLNVAYNGEDWRNPLNAASDPIPLEWDLVKDFPVVMMDRPVLMPQPGYVETSGNVNMRSAPDENARLMFQVPAGQVLDVLGRNPDNTWYHVRLGNGETGWMRADLLTQNLGTISLTYLETPVPPQRFGSLGTGARVIVAQGGNLRQAPDTYFNTITTLPQGTEVELVARSPYSPWVKVRSSGQEGWLALITIETQAVIAFLPIDYNAQLPPRPTSTPVFQFGGGHAYPDPNAGQ